MMAHRGFTLIEVLIAMAILAFVTIFTAQSISSALKNRTKIQKEIDSMGGVREALKVMEADINRSFNFRDINIQLYNETAKERNKKIQEARNKAGDGSRTIAPGGSDPGKDGQSTIANGDPYANMQEMKLKEEKIVTHFMGDAESLNFSSVSNARFSTEERTSDQAEIGYFLGDCKSRKDYKRSTKCLFRRLSTVIDDDVTQGGDTTALVEDVTKLEFRYIGPTDPPDWVKTWYTNERGDDKTKNKFPYAVEITLETQNKSDPNSKPVRMTIVAAIRNPNNPVPEAKEGETAGK